MSDFDPTALSDDELLAMRASWDEERPALWDHVVRHKGLDYQREYDAFMARKAQAESAIAELRARGLLRRGRPPRPAGKAETPVQPARRTDFTSAFVFEHSARRVRAGGDAHVRFEEKDRLALRAALRAAVPRLRFESGEVLRCAFFGPKPTVGTDVENLVLYNLGFGGEVLRGGVAFEYLNQPPPEGAVGYEYEPVAATSPLRLWEAETELITWSRVPLAELAASTVWYSLRRTGNPRETASAEADILVRVRLASARSFGVGEIKAVVDGMIAATQWMPDAAPERVELLTSILEERLARKLDIGEVGAMLAPDDSSVLGPCAGLIPADGRINPDDHRLVAGVVLIEPSTEATTQIIEASIHTADRLKRDIP